MSALVTVQQAAKELQMTPLTLRYLMQCGKLQIGEAWTKPGAKRGYYRVYRKLLDEEKQKRGLE